MVFIVNPKFSIIIPNWNGAAFLRRCIGATVFSAQNTGLPHEILLIDDASTDNSAEEIVRNWPQVKLVKNTQNLGFGKTINKGAHLATGDLLVFLNNDLVPSENMVEELLAPLLDNPQLFGVSGKTIEWYTGAPNHVNMMARIDNGVFRLTYEDSPSLTETMFLQGGSCAVRRDVFLDLGGFNQLFHPGYWEDYDISYFALKCGWQLAYNPRALGSHLGQGSMKRAYGASTVERFRARNRFLFEWLNFSDPTLVKTTTRHLPTLLAKAIISANKSVYEGFFEAIGKIERVKQVRLTRAKKWKLFDREVFEPFKARGIPSL